ncbi:MAG: DUF6119 family protein [Candidatus Kapaibacterium sp.]
MSKNNTATNRINLYLLKNSLTTVDNNIDVYLKDNVEKYELKENMILVYDESNSKTPEWVSKFFNNQLPQNIVFSNSSSKALILITVDDDTETYNFAVTFGFGRYLLMPNVWEEDFGLRTTLNLASEDKIRKVNTKKLTDIPRNTSNQISIASEIFNFNIDEEQELVESITAQSSDNKFGKTISGKESISFSTKIDIENIHDILKDIITHYKSEKYKEHFEWIDNIKPIKDKYKIKNLDNQLINEINNKNFDKLWLSVPDIIEWDDISYFKYNKNSEELDDIHIETYLDYLKSDKISTSDFNNIVQTYSEQKGFFTNKWKIYNCIYCELQYKEELFLLSNGKWFLINKDFNQRINEFYSNLTINTNILPKFSETDKPEFAYNKRVSEELGYKLFDSHNIPHGGGRSKIEFCDLYNSKEIIHVKRYTGSSTLSHLFNQGLVSAELILSDKSYRDKIDKINNVFLDANEINPDEYTVSYAILSHSSNDLDLPFFSKITLKNSLQRLKNYGFKYRLIKVDKV